MTPSPPCAACAACATASPLFQRRNFSQFPTPNLLGFKWKITMAWKFGRILYAFLRTQEMSVSRLSAGLDWVRSGDKSSLFLIIIGFKNDTENMKSRETKVQIQFRFYLILSIFFFLSPVIAIFNFSINTLTPFSIFLISLWFRRGRILPIYFPKQYLLITVIPERGNFLEEVASGLVFYTTKKTGCGYEVHGKWQINTYQERASCQKHCLIIVSYLFCYNCE